MPPYQGQQGPTNKLCVSMLEHKFLIHYSARNFSSARPPPCVSCTYALIRASSRPPRLVTYADASTRASKLYKHTYCTLSSSRPALFGSSEGCSFSALHTPAVGPLCSVPRKGCSFSVVSYASSRPALLGSSEGLMGSPSPSCEQCYIRRRIYLCKLYEHTYSCQQ